uniref:Uncharacterized protein n=1 Tax=Chromera velia CCMP2878 TaxID=1169474 RepID=A0A0G4FKB0_9ALVE|eukprot:Cvel_17402.t1-p1 / transcript=Cvel_17402.t1 / gene=Cvel_17402 / organism=Chromera_velia_CCMP2878 / gene_product=hypothetical protein / transcript_product=hypothetical protein / location=Cvel_scaffold1385:33646-36729(-) / protein_length=852 / sequence_SO=supercontig / SO=protein_coding / is_pseudo=false
MMRHFLFSLALLSAICRAARPQGPIGAQLHSFNDLRQWESLLVKGWTHMKIDPFFVPGGQESPCHLYRQREGSAVSSACFLLTHDTPSFDRLTYNTTDHLLDWIATHSEALKDVQRYIALCFKQVPGGGCDGSPAASEWLEAVDSFFDRAQKLVQETGVKIDFVLDGGGDPVGCKKDRWRPWKSVYISGGSPSAAFTSDDPSKGFDRFAILNEPVKMFPVSALAGFGKFAHSPLSIQIWEPRDEAQIAALSALYLATATNHTSGLRFATNSDPVQLEVFASPWNENLLLGEENNLLLEEDERVETNMSEPKLAGGRSALLAVGYVHEGRLSSSPPSESWGTQGSDGGHGGGSKSVSASVSQTILLEVFSSPQENNSPLLRIRRLGDACRDVGERTEDTQTGGVTNIPLHTLPSGADIRFMTLLDHRLSLSLCTQTETGEEPGTAARPCVQWEVVDFTLDPQKNPDSDTAFPSLSLSPYLSHKNPNQKIAQPSSFHTEATVPVPCPQGAHLSTCVLVLDRTPDCSLQLSLYLLPMSGKGTLLAPAVCAVPSTGSVRVKSGSASASLAQVEGPDSSPLTGPSGNSSSPTVLEGLLAFEGDSSDIFAISLAVCKSQSGQKRATSVPPEDAFEETFSLVLNQECTGTDRDRLADPHGLFLRKIHVGSSVHVASVSSGLGDSVSLLVWSDGFCPNSEPRNKQAKPGVCEQEPVSSPEVLNYAYAQSAAWRNLLGSGGTVSPCDASVLHGAFSMGTRPRGVLGWKSGCGSSSSASGDWFALVSREAFGGKDLWECGKPVNRRRGAWIDSWRVPQRLFSGSTGTDLSRRKENRKVVDSLPVTSSRITNRNEQASEIVVE